MDQRSDDFKITRYLTKQDLIEANEAAIREKRNKTLPVDFVDSLSDDFIFVVVWEYFHSKYEIRLGITFDFSGKMVLLDVSMTRFEALSRSKTYSDGTIEFEDPEETMKRRPYPNGRQWQETQTKKPIRKQDDFRKIVLKAYKSECAICDVNLEPLLRAAHIVPVINSDDDTVQNGICLCANHEIAFDKGLLQIFPDYSAYLHRESKSLVVKLPIKLEEQPLPQNLAKKLELLGIKWENKN